MVLTGMLDRNGPALAPHYSCRSAESNWTKIEACPVYVQYIIRLSNIGADYGSPSAALFLRRGRNRQFHPSCGAGTGRAALALPADHETRGRTGRPPV